MRWYSLYAIQVEKVPYSTRPKQGREGQESNPGLARHQASSSSPRQGLEETSCKSMKTHRERIPKGFIFYHNYIASISLPYEAQGAYSSHHGGSIHLNMASATCITPVLIGDPFTRHHCGLLGLAVMAFAPIPLARMVSGGQFIMQGTRL